jgi:hypothetical protein
MLRHKYSVDNNKKEITPMPKKGEKLPQAHRAAVSAALKGRKQSPEHVKARFDGLAKVRAATVRVSKNDAAMLEIARQYFNALGTKRRLDAESPFLDNAAQSVVNQQIQQLGTIGILWTDGEDVRLAKLSQ